MGWRVYVKGIKTLVATCYFSLSLEKGVEVILVYLSYLFVSLFFVVDIVENMFLGKGLFGGV